MVEDMSFSQPIEDQIVSIEQQLESTDLDEATRKNLEVRKAELQEKLEPEAAEM